LEEKKEFLDFTNLENLSGDLAKAIEGRNVFIGVSGPNVAKAEVIKSMGEKPIIFAMANPVPEIDPKEAKENGAFVMGTGRSDYPNQINNVLAFPGIFRGALDNKVNKITDEMKLAAAKALAGCVRDEELNVDFILPSPLDKSVVSKIAEVIK
jgi:malate dehydrogenase (oxaloacetate-decarboxylating)